jgi:citrate lyase subunit gamma (acyl carrier protein)
MVGTAGTKESNDCFVTVKPAEKRKIVINSIVGAFFYDQIMETVINALDELKADEVEVIIEDKGALDYTIRSRVISAVKRLRNDV